ncbi:MAG: hypothetical protein WC023_14115 [Rhodocyclaceae bacterium]|jgi:hypothetical protein
MNNELQRCRWRPFLAVVCVALSACAVEPGRSSSPEEIPLRAMLAYYGSNQRQPAESVRERPGAADPYLQMQQAIQLGQARPPELQRALNLLESVMKSAHPAAVSLSPLARALHDQYGERLRLEQQLREAQRRGDQLQEKIDALSAIERSLPARPLPAPKKIPRNPP